MKQTYRVIIAGSRDFYDYGLLEEKCDKLLSRKCATHNIIICSGAARGADRLGERYAQERGYDIETHRPNWEKEGRSAGMIRNAEMAKEADALICFWDGKSRGTAHMIGLARKYDLEVRVFNFRR